MSFDSFFFFFEQISFTAFTIQVEKKVIYHRTEYVPNSGFHSRSVSLTYMLQHKLSYFSKFLLFIKGPSREFLHYSSTYTQRHEPNLLSILGMSTAAVEFGSQKKVCKQCWELTFPCTCDFKKDLIFITGFSISCYAAVTVQPFHQNQYGTKLFPPYLYYSYTTLAHFNENNLI